MRKKRYPLGDPGSEASERLRRKLLPQHILASAAARDVEELHCRYCRRVAGVRGIGSASLEYSYGLHAGRLIRRMDSVLGIPVVCLASREDWEARK